MTLHEQIHLASELNTSGRRIEAVQALKDLAVGRDLAIELCDLIHHGDLHPSERATVMQVLGYHRVARKFADVCAILHEQAQKEKDLITLRACIFALQGCDCVTDFLVKRDVSVALEVAIYLPANTDSLQVVLQESFGGLAQRPFEVLCGRLNEFENIVPHVVSFLMTAEFKAVDKQFEERVCAIFGVLQQASLFEALADIQGEIERSYKTIWPGIWQRERQRKLLELFVKMVSEQGAQESLIDAVVQRVVAVEQSYERYVRFVRSLLSVLNTRCSLQWIAACESLGQKGDRALLSRLAETLIVLVKHSPLIVAEAQAVLGQWESQLPGVRMKAFHAAH